MDGPDIDEAAVVDVGQKDGHQDADGRCTRDGRYIEQVGRYNPNTDPSEITLDLEKVADWMAKGAQPTDTVVRLIDTVKKAQ